MGAGLVVATTLSACAPGNEGGSTPTTPFKPPDTPSSIVLDTTTSVPGSIEIELAPGSTAVVADESVTAAPTTEPATTAAPTSTEAPVKTEPIFYVETGEWVDKNGKEIPLGVYGEPWIEHFNSDPDNPATRWGIYAMGVISDISEEPYTYNPTNFAPDGTRLEPGVSDKISGKSYTFNCVFATIGFGYNENGNPIEAKMLLGVHEPDAKDAMSDDGINFFNSVNMIAPFSPNFPKLANPSLQSFEKVLYPENRKTGIRPGLQVLVGIPTGSIGIYLDDEELRSQRFIAYPFLENATFGTNYSLAQALEDGKLPNGGLAPTGSLVTEPIGRPNLLMLPAIPFS